MPFMVHDKCYPDALTALDVWKQDFPTEPVAGVSYFVNAAAINATTGTITGTFGRSNATTTTAITGIKLNACDLQSASQIFDKYPVQDIGFAAALTFALLVGFSNGKTVRFF